MKTIKVKEFSDAGHGWARVLRSDVIASGAVISRFSYISPSGKYAYLEEDCDYGAFLREAARLGWVIVKLPPSFGANWSSIRTYPMYMMHDALLEAAKASGIIRIIGVV